MEAANYNSRRMVNVMLDNTGSIESPCKITSAYRPPEWAPLKAVDEQRYAHGQPNLFDTDLTAFRALKPARRNRPALDRTPPVTATRRLVEREYVSRARPMAPSEPLL
jgi:hypothetical protein